MNKSEWRIAMKRRNRALPPEEKRAAAERIFAAVEALPEFAQARCVACFCALPDEPPTAEVLRRWSGSKRVVVPRVEGDTMRFYDYRPDALVRGAFGIDEPAVGECVGAGGSAGSTASTDPAGGAGSGGSVDPAGRVGAELLNGATDAVDGPSAGSIVRECLPEMLDLVVVPGVAFTREGARLGRGRGYYDRYLSRPGLRAFCIGVCFAHQLVDTLPVEPHDRTMDAVCAG